MKKSVLELTEKDAIQAETREQAIELCKLFDSLGLEWSSGESYFENNNWNIYYENTCYLPKKGGYCNIQYFKENGYTIHKATDFICIDEVEVKGCEDFEKQTDLEVLKTYLRAKLIIAEYYKDRETAEEILELIEKYNLI